MHTRRPELRWSWPAPGLNQSSCPAPELAGVAQTRSCCAEQLPSPRAGWSYPDPGLNQSSCPDPELAGAIQTHSCCPEQLPRPGAGWSYPDRSCCPELAGVTQIGAVAQSWLELSRPGAVAQSSCPDPELAGAIQTRSCCPEQLPRPRAGWSYPDRSCCPELEPSQPMSCVLARHDCRCPLCGLHKPSVGFTGSKTVHPTQGWLADCPPSVRADTWSPVYLASVAGGPARHSPHWRPPMPPLQTVLIPRRE